MISAGGTGTYDINTAATEIQAGSYALMDTAYAKLGLPFGQALSVLATVVSVSPGWAVADCGAKAVGMDHGNPTIDGAEVWFCSDEHVTFAPGQRLEVGAQVRVIPAHVDPTVAYHDRMLRGGRRRCPRELAGRPPGLVSAPRPAGGGALQQYGRARVRRKSPPGASHMASTQEPGLRRARPRPPGG